MNEYSTTAGRLMVGTREELFTEAVRLIAAQHAAAAGRRFLCACSGGSTPQDWYRWCVSTQAIPASVAATTHFTVSDERHVPLDSPQSNFGNAERLLLSPLGVPREHRHPWVVAYEPEAAAEAYRKTLLLLAGPGRAYDVCMLGMGDDAHTASFFPGSPLLHDDGGLPFAAVDCGAKGWRLTVTPTGLAWSGLTIVMALGAGKAEALARVLEGPADVAQAPAQVLARLRDRVVWLVDEAAASRLQHR